MNNQMMQIGSDATKGNAQIGSDAVKENMDKELLKAGIAYFKERDAYTRSFRLMREKWKRYGKVCGNVSIPAPTQAEREVLGGFLGKDFDRGLICFSMKQFEQALAETRFAGIDLKDLIGGYYGEELRSNRETAEEKMGQKQRFFDSLQMEAGKRWGEESNSGRWLAEAARQKKYGYQMLLQAYECLPEKAGKQAENVCLALECLPHLSEDADKAGIGGRIRLAMLGAKTTKNPHAFDKETAEGKLLIQALACLKGVSDCKNAEDILMLYASAGIRTDDISSFTTAYGIHLYENAKGDFVGYLTDKEYAHPAYEAYIERGEPYLLSMLNLERIIRADAKSKIVYIVENQMVFSHLCERLNGRETALVCTSGRMKVASWMLLDMLAASGCRLMYSGDFDPEGLAIAEKLLLRYPQQASLWHMGIEDYQLSMSEEIIDERRMREMDKLTMPEFQQLKDAVMMSRKAGYQEQLTEKMLEDMRSYRD